MTVKRPVKRRVENQPVESRSTVQRPRDRQADVPPAGDRRYAAQRTGERKAADRAPSRRKKKPRRRWPFVVLAVVVFVAAVVGLFSWDRWLRYDDTKDITGIWFVVGSDGAVAIDDQVIALTADVSYRYTLDTFAKTISFSFGDLKGTGHYRFSADRSRLVIFEGDANWWIIALFEDVGAAAQEMWLSLQGQSISATHAADGVTSLSRAPVEETSAAPESDASSSGSGGASGEGAAGFSASGAAGTSDATGGSSASEGGASGTGSGSLNVTDKAA